MKDTFGFSLAEASTWRSLVVLLTVVGIKLEPDQMEAIATAGAAIYVVFGLFFKRKPSA